jgi:lipoprotein-anchoring transpeptidase ErfK/SrfK
MGRTRTLVLVGVLVLLVTGAGWAGTRLAGSGDGAAGGQVRTAAPIRAQADPASSPVGAPAESVSTPTTPAATPAATPASPASTPLRVKPALEPGDRLLGPGDRGPKVRDLQARLRQLLWYSGDVTDRYGPRTTAAVKGFQDKRGFPVTGYVDARTQRKLRAMTHRPTTAELENKVTPMGNVPGKLDKRCLTGRVLCIDKQSRTLRFVVDGQVRRTVDVRFGAAYSPTREGVFSVYWKDATHVSKLYGSAMPWAMFFSRGQAVHYSSDFAARGYAGASHGCVNVRDLAGVKWLFAHVKVGDKVVIYWS